MCEEAVVVTADSSFCSSHSTVTDLAYNRTLPSRRCGSQK